MRTLFYSVSMTAGSLARDARLPTCAAWRSATALYAAGLGPLKLTSQIKDSVAGC